MLWVVVTTTMALLFCSTLASPTQYHHMAYVGLRQPEQRPQSRTAPEELRDLTALSRRDDQQEPPLQQDPEGDDAGPEEQELQPDERPRALSAPVASSARQAPYSYYYIGRKLWYVPLYFSLYFVIYVGALIIRAIARHKVTFPDRLPKGRDLDSAHTESSRIDRASVTVNTILEDMMLKYM